MVWCDLGLNPSLPDYWRTLNPQPKIHKYSHICFIFISFYFIYFILFDFIYLFLFFRLKIYFIYFLFLFIFIFLYRHLYPGCLDHWAFTISGGEDCAICDRNLLPMFTYSSVYRQFLRRAFSLTHRQAPI